MMKTAELTGAALDWAVAKCEGEPVYSYSTNWIFGGPIIEREGLCVGTRYTSDQIYVDGDVLCWARTPAGGYLKYGGTPLIAAMRCYVASTLGDEVDVPEELLP